jgi:hypothetical protein
MVAQRCLAKAHYTRSFACVREFETTLLNYIRLPRCSTLPTGYATSDPCFCTSFSFGEVTGNCSTVAY